jgi:hypothetical protein
MNLSATDKVRALRELTRGAEDVFATYRIGNSADKDCWRPVYAELRDDNILAHLAGRIELGSYPLMPVGGAWPRVYWVLADFDGKKGGVDWQADVKRAVQFLLDFEGCPCFVNLSRSGQGAHIRMLFKEPVSAWMARRWLNSWLEEAEVIRPAESWEHEVPSSFDRLIPPQDNLSGQLNPQGNRLPGNLAGSPLHAGHARSHNGTLPLDPHEVARGNFEPDGRHWEHVMTALEQRAWGEAELRAAIADAPDAPDLTPPTGHIRRHLGTISSGDSRSLDYMLSFCKFIHHLQNGGFTYPLWVSLATQLHRFGADGQEVFHELSHLDPRYDSKTTDQKWRQTQTMLPIRCDSMVAMGFRCPHLTDSRCNGAKAPTYFADNTDAEIL